MKPRPNCPGCGASSSIYHWHYCVLHPEAQQSHCNAVYRVEEENRRAAAHEVDARRLGMEIG